MRDVGLRAGELLEPNETSDPIPLLLLTILHKLLVGDRPMVRVPYIRTVAAPAFVSNEGSSTVRVRYR